jgi:hypothetical protein
MSDEGNGDLVPLSGEQDVASSPAAMKKRKLFPTPVLNQIARSGSLSQVPYFRETRLCDDVSYVDGTKVVEEVEYVPHGLFVF